MVTIGWGLLVPFHPLYSDRASIVIETNYPSVPITLRPKHGWSRSSILPQPWASLGGPGFFPQYIILILCQA
jgi:hypothetical protein